MPPHSQPLQIRAARICRLLPINKPEPVNSQTIAPMKKLFIASAVTVLLGSRVYADGTPATTNVTSTSTFYSSDNAGRFGAGVILGEPIGLSLKYWLTDDMAIDGAAGWSAADHTDFYLHSDVLWHKFDLFPVPNGRLPLYFGVGGLLRIRDDNNDNQVGIRAPIGVSYMFDREPIDIFVEVAPAIDISPSVRGDITGGVGIRYWF
jgi:hypothetical protein